MSGRKFITVMVISTYCIIEIAIAAMVLLGIMPLDTFLATLGGTNVVVLLIAEWYFEKKKRKEEK